MKELKEYEITKDGIITKAEDYCIDLITDFINWAKEFKKHENGSLIPIDENLKNKKGLGIKNYYYTKIEVFEDLKDYFFGNLYNQKTFGPKYYPDGDDTELAKAILFLFYKAKTKHTSLDLFKMKISPRIKYTTILFNGRELKGDTINTFGTLFGGSEHNLCEWSLNTEINENNKKYISPKFLDNDELKKEIYNFHKKYQTIGNFYMLPNNTCRLGNSHWYSLNGFRGTDSMWGDYFDIFLNALKNKNSKEIELLKDKNKEYFDKINFKKFIKLNSFKDYIDKDEIINLSDIEKNKIVYRNSNFDNNCDSQGKTKNEYQEFAKNYIRKATELIDKRSTIIIKVIKRQYKKFKCK